MLKFRYMTLVQNRVRGSVVDVALTPDGQSTQVQLPFAVPSLDHWMLGPSFARSTGMAFDIPVQSIERLSPSMLVFRGLASLHLSIDPLIRNLLDGHVAQVLDDIAELIARQVRATAALAEAIEPLVAVRSAQTVISELQSVKHILEQHHSDLFRSIWFDEGLLDEIQRIRAPSEDAWSDLLNRSLPRSGVNILRLPASIRGAKRTSLSLTVDDPRRLVEFLAVGPGSSSSLISTTDPWSTMVSGTLELAERLSQNWAAFISVLSTAISRCPEWEDAWREFLDSCR